MNESALQPKMQLTIYKTMVDKDKFQLLEMSLRHDAMLLNLPEAFSGEAYTLLDSYLKQLRSILNACDAVRNAIDNRLTEIE